MLGGDRFASSGILPLRSARGFEALVGGVWVSLPASSVTKDTVTLRLSAALAAAGAETLRYNWYSNPCGYYPFGCAVYVTHLQCFLLF